MRDFKEQISAATEIRNHQLQKVATSSYQTDLFSTSGLKDTVTPQC